MIRRFCSEKDGGGEISGEAEKQRVPAARKEHPDIEFICGDMSDLHFIKDQYDVVFRSLALHYLEDFGAFAKYVYELTAPGGYFIFSQEHPLTTAPITGASIRSHKRNRV